MKAVFPIVPASNVTLYFVGGISLFMLIMICFFLSIGWATRFTSFEVTPDKLTIHGDIYSRSIPRTELMLDRAKVVDLRNDSEHRMTLRTNGCGMPGYASGWFRLQNGDKALVFVTNQHSVLYIPTTRGYFVLLSPTEPQALLDALHRP